MVGKGPKGFGLSSPGAGLEGVDPDFSFSASTMWRAVRVMATANAVAGAGSPVDGVPREELEAAAARCLSVVELFFSHLLLDEVREDELAKLGTLMQEVFDDVYGGE